MSWLRRSALALALAGLWQAAGERFDFESAAAGTLAPGWIEVNSDSSLSNNWAVLSHLDAPSGSRILAKTAMLIGPGRLPKAIWQGRSFRDGEVKVQIKPMGGLDSESAGLVFRYRDDHHYYLFSANLLTGEVTVHRVEADKTSVVATSAGAFQPNPVGWTFCRVSFEGSRVVVYVNGNKCLEAVNSGEGWTGKAGLWATRGSFTSFDDFEVTTTD